MQNWPIVHYCSSTKMWLPCCFGVVSRGVVLVEGEVAMVQGTVELVAAGGAVETKEAPRAAVTVAAGGLAAGACLRSPGPVHHAFGPGAPQCEYWSL